jgi:hypothetical protein
MTKTALTLATLGLGTALAVTAASAQTYGPGGSGGEQRTGSAANQQEQNMEQQGAAPPAWQVPATSR